MLELPAWACSHAVRPGGLTGRGAQATVLAALQQPAPETFALFDDVMLISEGVVLFHGPRPDVLPFFQRLGFACLPRKDPAGFLQEVTSARDQAVRRPAWPVAAAPSL